MEASDQAVKKDPWEDGTFSFSVKRADGTMVDHVVDFLVVKIAAEEIEINCGITPDPTTKAMIPTTSFLAALALKFQEIGVSDCTPTIAYRLWAACHDYMNGLKKRPPSTPESPSGSE